MTSKARFTGLKAIFKREFKGYFASPLGYIFIVIFLVASGWLTLSRDFGRFLELRQASLDSFFTYIPWIFVVLVPAVAMRLWAEERKTGTVELLMTLPVTMWQAVAAKFLAAWAFVGIALCLTFPMWLTVNYLGEPDNGVILASYFGSFLMAGAYLAIGACISATTKNQVIAFVISVVACFLFILAGFPVVTNFFGAFTPDVVVETIAGFSFLTHFDAITKGVIDLRDIVFFASLIGCFLFANAVIVELKKAD